MNQEQDDRNDLNRAVLAEQVTTNTIYQEAFVMFRAQLMDSFRNTKFKDSDERDEIWRKMQTVQYVEDYLTEVMESGKVAKASLTLLERSKNVIGL